MLRRLKGEDEASGQRVRMFTIDRRKVLCGAAALWLAQATQARAQSASLSFLAVGDWGRQGERSQTDVAAAMAVAAAEVDSRFVLSVGDNFYPSGVQSVADPHWKASFEDVYAQASLQTPWYAILGNHDYRGQPDAQIAYGRESQRWNMPNRYYQVAGGPVGADLEIFMLDTTPIAGDFGPSLMRLSWGHGDNTDPARQLAWLDAQLGRSRAAWKVVVGHHPIRSGGRHGGSVELARLVEPLLQKHGVQLYICGHDHTLQHIQADGVHHVCVGAGSSAGRVSPVEGTLFAASEPGFGIFTLADGAMQVAFRGAGGAKLYEASLSRQTA